MCLQYYLHAGLSGATEGRNLLCSPNAEHKALRSSNFQHITFFFFCSACGLLSYFKCIVTRGHSSSSLRRRRRTPPPHAAARRRRRIIPPLRCRSTPPLSPRSRSPTSLFAPTLVHTHLLLNKEYHGSPPANLAAVEDSLVSCRIPTISIVDLPSSFVVVAFVTGPAALRRGEGRQSTVLEGRRQGRGRRRGFRVGEDGHCEDDPAQMHYTHMFERILASSRSSTDDDDDATDCTSVTSTSRGGRRLRRGWRSDTASRRGGRSCPMRTDSTITTPRPRLPSQT